MKMTGLILLILGIIGVAVSFSIPGLIGFFVFLLSLLCIIASILLLIKAKKRRSRSYSFR
ncbi:hypothetical protein [Listeria fleischmannii]|uniref:Uncharacterized protein n=1 Tax=Listeria fleischmannii TaxID=1069827 RepID=A0A841YDP9_9LIST|nr:hypothetical protein [Listeria fleischmannii]EIA19929.1 hypothetical protein KKC_09792 [Listeria fleischmannii subsp. coloradonensis]MBC1398350.1 hypothetical protein [Listeria fleischmannii]MBC1418679.1 hypothetical protein [Listeria fleischmannii]MBC1426411.1 hypothetical protein [Listeria fleischmannii]